MVKHVKIMRIRPTRRVMEFVLTCWNYKFKSDMFNRTFRVPFGVLEEKYIWRAPHSFLLKLLYFRRINFEKNLVWRIGPKHLCQLTKRIHRKLQVIHILTYYLYLVTLSDPFHGTVPKHRVSPTVSSAKGNPALLWRVSSSVCYHPSQNTHRPATHLCNTWISICTGNIQKRHGIRLFLKSRDLGRISYELRAIKTYDG